MEYITKKIPRRAVRGLRKLQARLQLKTKKRLPEARVIEKAIEFAEKKEKEFMQGFEKKYTLLDMAGFINKKGRRNATRELDEVVYAHG